MPRGFGALLLTQWRLMSREPGYWITSVGLAAIVIIIYGSILSTPNPPELGIVLEDASPTLDAAADELDRIGGISVQRGTLDKEIAALEDGDRWAIVIFPEGTIDSAQNGEEATARIVYNDASPYEGTAGQGILRQFVAELNNALGVSGGIAIDEQTIEADRGIGLLETLFPGLLGMSLMLGNSLAASMFVAWRQAGILKRISSSPVRPLTLEAAQFVTLLAVSALQVTVLIVLARALFGVHVAGDYGAVAAVAFVGAVAFMGIWYALAAVLTNPTSFFATMNLTSFVMIFLGGSVVPNDDVPSWLQPVVEVLPLTHLNDALRGVINDAGGLSSVAGDVGILAAWGLAAFAVSARLFRWSGA